MRHGSKEEAHVDPLRTGVSENDGMPEHPDAPSDVEERLETDPRDEPNLTDQPGHDVDRRQQADT